MGTQILTTKDIPADEADTLGDRFGELVQSCDGFAGVHPEYNFQIVQVTRGLVWRLDWGARLGGADGRLDRDLRVHVYIGFLVTLIVMRFGIVGKISIEASTCFFTPNSSSREKRTPPTMSHIDITTSARRS